MAAFEDLARGALAEVTAAANVGELVEERRREDASADPASTDTVQAATVVDVVFESTQRGYRGWFWVVSVAEVDGEAPSVLELGQLPGDDALIAPEWVPWSARLAEWQAQQAATAAEAAEDAESDDEESDDDADDDESDDDEDADDVEDDDSDDEDDEESDDDADDDDDDEPMAHTHGGDIDGVDIEDAFDDD